MSYSLHSHVRSDKVKWGLVVFALLVVGAILCGLMTNWYKEFNPFCWFGHDYGENNVCVRCGKDKPIEEMEKANGNVVLNTVMAKGMLLNSAPAVVAAGEEQSYTLTATITPASADDKRVEWTVTWKDPGSAWANGKAVTEYVTVTPTSLNSLTATVACFKDFGEQVIVTVTSLDNAEVNAKCTVDYVQRITGFTFNMPSVSSATTSFTYDVEYSNYTIVAETEVYFSDNLQLNNVFKTKFLELCGDFSSSIFISAPLLSSRESTLTLMKDIEAIESWEYYDKMVCRNVTGLIGCFVVYDSMELSSYYGKTEGDIISAFRQTLTTVPVVGSFNVSYSTKYNGKVYSQGNKIVDVRLDEQSLHVPAEEINIDHGAIVI